MFTHKPQPYTFTHGEEPYKPEREGRESVPCEFRALRGLTCPPSIFRRMCFLAGPVVLQRIMLKRLLIPVPMHTCSCPTTGCLLAHVLTDLSVLALLPTLSIGVSNLRVRFPAGESRAEQNRATRGQHSPSILPCLLSLVNRMCLASWSVINKGTGLPTGRTVGRLLQDHCPEPVQSVLQVSFSPP